MKAARLAAILLATLLAAASAHAQIAFRGASSAGIASAFSPAYVGQGNVASTSTGTCPSITPTVPAGNVGDLLVAVVASGDNVAISMAGWNTLFADAPVATYQAKLFWRVAQAANASTITRGAASGCNVIIARISRFSGVDPLEPIQGIFAPGTLPGGTQPVCTNPGGGSWCYQNSNTVSTGTQTTLDPDAMLVMTAHTADNSSLVGGIPAGFIAAWENTTTLGNDAAIALFYAPQTVNGTFGPYSMNKNLGSDPNHGVLFALRSKSLRINVPAGTLAGDVMIAGIAARPCSGTSGGACTTTIVPPAGWTLVNSFDQTIGGGTGGFGNLLYVYQRVATATEPAAYVWGFGGAPINNGAVGGIVSFSGVDTTSPIVVDAGQVTPSAATHTAPSIDTGAVTNTMLVGSFVANSSATWTPAPGMTEALDVPSLPVPDALGLSIEMTYEARAAAGATGTRAATQSTPPANDAGATHMLALRPAVTFNHYAISGVTGGLTCAPTDVTITAHDATHGAAFPPNGTTVTLSTSTGTGVWLSPLVAGPGTWTPSGLNNGSATYTWTGAESSFSARLRHNTPVALSVNLLDGGGRVEDGAEDPGFTFVDTGFRVTADGTTTASIATHIAGKNSNVGFGAQTLYLQAVRTDTNTGSCVGTFGSQVVTIEMAGARLNPTGGASQVSVQNNVATMVPLATSAGAPAGYTAITLAFDVQSKAPLVFTYPDAGSIQLYARYQLPSPPASTYMSGSSNAFVVRPFGLRISGVTSGAAGPGDPVFAKAGANFNATLTAVVWKAGDDADANGVPDSDAQIAANAATPNFGQEAAPANATMTHALNAPGGGNAGTLGGTTTYTGFVAGTRTQAINWSEVGIIDLFAQSANYLGTGQTVRNSTAGLTGVGRFYPDHFFLAAGSTLTNRQAAACAPASSFTYLDEGFGLAFTLRARNTANAVTQNYTTASGFAKLDPATIASLNLGAMSGATNLTARIDTALGSAGSFVAGAADVTATLGIRRATPDDPDGPFSASRVGIAPADSDGVTLRAADLNMDVDGVGGNDHQQVGANTEFRYGRLRMSNATGSEKLALSIPVQAQHWNGIGFVTNTLDSCTSIPRSAFALDFTPVSNLTPCETAMGVAGLTVASGAAALSLTAPGTGNNGTVLVTANLGTAGGSYCDPAAYVPASNAGLSYLLGRWNDAVDPDSNASTAYDDKPAARAAFGLYGATPDNVIYMRENF